MDAQDHADNLAKAAIMAGHFAKDAQIISDRAQGKKTRATYAEACSAAESFKEDVALLKLVLEPVRSRCMRNHAALTEQIGGEFSAEAAAAIEIAIEIEGLIKSLGEQ